MEPYRSDRKIKLGEVEYIDGQRQVWTGKNWVVATGEPYANATPGKLLLARLLRKLGANV